MKKFGGLALLVVILAVGVYYLMNLKEAEENATEEPMADFSIQDTANIAKFKISDTEGNEITITREKTGNTWMIGETGYKAQPYNANLILATFYSVEKLRDVNDNEKDNAISKLGARHQKVEVWNKGDKDPFKTWFVGGSTNDHKGTHMLLKKGNKKSSVPYIMYKPGMNGTLDIRFFTSFKDWRFSGVFNIARKDIKQIKVTFNKRHNDSYTAVNNGDGEYALLDGAGMAIPMFDTSHVSHYFTHYKKIHFEKVNDELYEDQVDSIFRLIPDMEIKLEDTKGNTTQAELWLIQMPEGFLDANGRPVEFDPERAWCRLNGDKELVKIQFYSWDVLFKPLPYFVP